MRQIDFMKCLVQMMLFFIIAGCEATKTSELHIGVLNPPKSLVNWQARDGVSYLIVRQIHRGLLWFNPQSNRLEPFAAKSLEFTDASTLTFKLDRSRRFHDGSRLSCGDVLKVFENLKSVGQQLAFEMSNEFDLTCQADQLVFKFSQAVPAKFLETLAAPALAITKANGKIGLGPYKLAIDTPQRIVLDRIWGNGLPRLVFRVGSADDLVEQFKRGKIQDLLYLGLFQSPKVDCQLISGLIPTTFWFNINARKWGFAKYKVRRALQLVLAKTVSESGLFSDENLIWSLVPPSVPGSIKNDQAPKFSRADFERAKLLLNKERQKHGKIQFVLRKSMADEVNWPDFFNQMDPQKELFSIEFLENEEYFARYYKGELALSFLGSNVSRSDPFEILDNFRKGDAINPAGVKQDFVDQLSKLASQESNPTAWAEKARSADRWIIEQAFVVPLFSKRFRGCVHKDLKGYVIDPRGPLSVDYAQINYH